MDPEFTAINLVKLAGEEHAGRPVDPALDMLINELVRIGPARVLLALAHLPWSAPGLDHAGVERWLDERIAALDDDDVPPSRPHLTIVRDDDPG